MDRFNDLTHLVHVCETNKYQMFSRKIHLEDHINTYNNPEPGTQHLFGMVEIYHRLAQIIIFTKSEWCYRLYYIHCTCQEEPVIKIRDTISTPLGHTFETKK